MTLVSGPIPECSTQELFAAAFASVTGLYADLMAKNPSRQDAQNANFEALVEAALNVDPKGLSGKHKNERVPSKGRSKGTKRKPSTQ